MNTSPSPAVSALVRAHGHVWLRDRCGTVERLAAPERRDGADGPMVVPTTETRSPSIVVRAMDKIARAPRCR